MIFHQRDVCLLIVNEPHTQVVYDEEYITKYESINIYMHRGNRSLVPCRKQCRTPGGGFFKTLSPKWVYDKSPSFTPIYFLALWVARDGVFVHLKPVILKMQFCRESHFVGLSQVSVVDSWSPFVMVL
jgi:hypothetical protein